MLHDEHLSSSNEDFSSSNVEENISQVDQVETFSEAESNDALGGRNTLNRRYLLCKIREAHQNTKVVCVQALAYVTSFFIVLSCPFANAVTKNDNFVITRLLAILVPLQGEQIN